MANYLCGLFLALITSMSYAQTCSISDQTLTAYALQVATADGHKQPNLVVGVIKVESSAGTASKYRVVKHGKQSTFYGAGQLTIAAAKEVMRRFPDLWDGFNTQTDEELKARLILDDKFNIRVASKYLLIMGVNHNADKGVAAYNLGLGGVESVDYRNYEYTKKVRAAARL